MVEELRQLLKAADLEGPWEAVEDEWDGWRIDQAYTVLPNGLKMVGGGIATPICEGVSQGEAHARLIVAAVNGLSDLLDRLEAAEAKVAAALPKEGENA